MGRQLSIVIRTSAVTFAIAGLALAAVACGSDEKTDTGSSGSSGDPADSGRTVIYEDSGTGATGDDCNSVTVCEGATCKCAEGANKDKTCQKTDKAQPAYCESICKVCK